ncbi:MAG: hypothetical protein L0G70_03860 [Rubrobacter sp.]|nr:hypothetical protein [Rubrobacter sp.]
MSKVSNEKERGPIEIPEEYEVLDASALGKRLGLKRETVLSYLARKNYRVIPEPDRRLAMGPLWYEGSVRQWEIEKRRRRGQER